MIHYYTLFSKNRLDTISYAQICKKEFANYFHGRIRNSLSAQCIFGSFLDLSQFLDLEESSYTFSLINLTSIQRQLCLNIEIYHAIEGDVLPYYNPIEKVSPGARIFKIMLRGDEPELNEEIRNFTYLFTDVTMKVYFYCKISKNCHYRSSYLQHLKDHESVCEINSKQMISGSQKPYGEDIFILKEIVASGYLPVEAMTFQKTIFSTFDIETYEILKNHSQTENTFYHAIHQLLSIGIGNNQGFSKCWVRKNDTHESAIDLIEQFIEGLEELRAIDEKQVPDYFINSIDMIEDDLKNEITTSKYIQLSAWKRCIENFIKTDIYGYNSAKFDLTVLAPYLFGKLKDRFGTIYPLKKVNSYFTVNVGPFVFKDVMLFTSPMSLSKYLIQNRIKAKKSIFPYSAYNSVEALRSATEYPSYEMFFDTLRKKNVPMVDYIEAKNEFNRRKQ